MLCFTSSKLDNSLSIWRFDSSGKRSIILISIFSTYEAFPWPSKNQVLIRSFDNEDRQLYFYVADVNGNRMANPNWSTFGEVNRCFLAVICVNSPIYIGIDR